MILSFGMSWPANVLKSYRARTAKGKSISFLCLIFFGYIAGIASKFTNEAYMAAFSEKWYVLFFYVLNFLMVGADLIMYVRNYRLDLKAKAEAEATVNAYKRKIDTTDDKTIDVYADETQEAPAQSEDHE